MQSEKAPKPFPWEAAMAFGLGVLKLSPDAFWAMTPRELAAAMRGRGGGAVRTMDRDSLDALMRDYPDMNEETSDG